MTSSPRAKPFDWRNLRLRAISAAVLAPVVLGIVWLGGWLFLLLVAAAVGLLSVEWGLMSAPRWAFGAAVSIALAVLMAVFVAFFGPMWAAWVVLPVGAAAAAAFARLRGLSERPADAAFGVLYIGAPSVALIWLRSGEVGRDWTLMLLAIAWSADIFAFVAGSLLKGPKLWPRFSPNKTWSGLAGGLAASALAALLVVAIAKGEGDPTRGWAAMIGLVVGLFTMAGDLWESMLKRRFGVKDSGQLIPGHGGLLDRVDGLMFAILAMAAARLVAHVTGYL
jgi:phosphatidate cytidylyltransferase